jgi:hypothetical protein
VVSSPRSCCTRERAEGSSSECLRRRSKDGATAVSVDAFAGLGKMAALIGQLDGGDDAEAGTSDSEAWRAEGAGMELGSSSMGVADPEWPVAEL